MNLKRILNHLSYPHWRTRLVFPKAALKAIEAAVKESEAHHDGELRFAVEGGLDIPHLLRGLSSRQRAVEVFSQLRVWDTEHNSGVLIYVQLADRQVEIVADRGIHARVGDKTWQEVCGRMERAFRDGRFEEGAVVGVKEIGALLAAHFPPRGANPNELPDRPVIL